MSHLQHRGSAQTNLSVSVITSTEGGPSKIRLLVMVKVFRWAHNWEMLFNILSRAVCFTKR